VGAVVNPGLVKGEGEHFGQITEVEEGPEIDVCPGVDAKGFWDCFWGGRVDFFQQVHYRICLLRNEGRKR
jgi:hypothetical protein